MVVLQDLAPNLCSEEAKIHCIANETSSCQFSNSANKDAANSTFGDYWCPGMHTNLVIGYQIGLDSHTFSPKSSKLVAVVETNRKNRPNSGKSEDYDLIDRQFLN